MGGGWGGGVKGEHGEGGSDEGGLEGGEEVGFPDGNGVGGGDVGVTVLFPIVFWYISYQIRIVLYLNVS